MQLAIRRESGTGPKQALIGSDYYQFDKWATRPPSFVYQEIIRWTSVNELLLE